MATNNARSPRFSLSVTDLVLTLFEAVWDAYPQLRGHWQDTIVFVFSAFVANLGKTVEKPNITTHQPCIEDEVDFV